MRLEQPWTRNGWRRALVTVMVVAAVAVLGVAAARAADENANTAPAAQAQPPKIVVFPNRVGEVDFPHAMHIDDLGIDCGDCHHPVRAPELQTPHPQYFKECQVPCSTCHRADGTTEASHNCASCHKEAGPKSGKMLSSKVALHQMCGNCHEIGTGEDASKSCSFCHTGPRKPW